MSETLLRKAKTLLTGTLMLLGFSATSQTIVVTGTVTSAEDQQPLIGVSIAVKGTQQGTSTDVNGAYSLEVPPDAVLQFNYTGYEIKVVSVNGQSVLNVSLKTDQQLLDDVIVVGYKKEIKSNVSSAISSVKAKDIEHLPLLGLDQALQGQAAGVQITQATGAPGDDIAVRIRGAGTLGNNNPLYIIDGVPTTGNINMFAISDIESIEVLKDGESASIYCARTANGVNVITTKKGKKGSPVFNFDTYYGIQEANRLPELPNAELYLLLRNEGITNSNELRDEIRQLPTYDPAILDTLADTDWLGEVFRAAPTQRHSLSASGGGDNSSFYILGEYLNQEGVFRKQGFEKYLLRFNGDIGGKKLKIGNNISLSYVDRYVMGGLGDGVRDGSV